MDSERPDATNDVVFHYVMGSEGSEDSLKSFINAVQIAGGETPTDSVEIKNPFNARTHINDKLSILDVLATGADGRRYNIEVQSLNQSCFLNRILYYWSGCYHSQLQNGAQYWLLNPTISILVARFTLFPNLSGFHNMFRVCSQKDPTVLFSDHLLIHTLELSDDKPFDPVQDPSSDKRERLVKWLDYFENANKKTEAEMNAATIADPGLKLAWDRYTHFCSDEHLRDLAEAEEKRARDTYGQIDYALQKGLSQGLSQGRAEGRAEGRVEGRVEGRAEGKAKTLLKILRHQYVEPISPEVESAILVIIDEDRVDQLIDATYEGIGFEDFCKMIYGSNI